MSNAVEILELIGGVFVGAGAFFILSGAVGLVRMPDFYTRLHPAGVKDSFGAPLVFIGLMFYTGWSLATLKIGLLMVFFLLTSPTACHALAKAAIASELKPLGGVDEGDGDEEGAV